MASEPLEGPEETELDEEGGPVKPFLDHLEDLRWTLIRCSVAIVLGMTVCMVAADKVIAFLTWPLKQAQKSAVSTNQVVAIHLGTNFLGRVPLQDFLATNPEATNSVRPKSLNLIPRQVGTNLLVAFDWDTNPFDAPDPMAVALKNYSPIGSLMVAFQVAFYGGLVLAFPFVLVFVGHYVLPALHLNEKKLVYQVAGIGSFLFLLGVAFCYFVLLQVALMASVQFSVWMGFGADEWRAEDYLSFVCKFLLVMGGSFELPVIILILVKIGLLDYKKLSAFRSYWIVINLVICAVLTPSGDPLTMFIMAAPLHVLYEISVLIAYIWYRRDLKASESAA